MQTKWKKLILAVSALIVALTLAACSAGGDNNSVNNGGNTAPTGGGSGSQPIAGNSQPSGSSNVSVEPAQADSPTATPDAEGLASNFFNMFSSGTYHMKAKMTAAGEDETIMESFVKSGMMATVMEADGDQTRMIYRDNKMYIVMDSTKMVMVNEMPAASASQAGGAVETAGMTVSGSGTAEFDGRTLPYEEYADEDGNKVQYFMDGNTLTGIRNVLSSGEGAIDIVVLELDQNVPDNVFVIPDDYQQMGI